MELACGFVSPRAGAWAMVPCGTIALPIREEASLSAYPLRWSWRPVRAVVDCGARLTVA